ncbi:MAG: integrin alpha, partial [Gammaproteobacteria bacterium]
SAGDVNGDGFDDVIIGSPRYGQPFNPPIPNQGSGQQGAAFVFLGSASGIVGTDPQTAHATIVPVSAGAPSQTRAFFGWSVDAAGDINSDGYTDIIIGAPNWNADRSWPGLDTGEPPGEGAAFIYLGDPSGISGTNPTNAATQIDGDLLDAAMGVSVAGVGDVNADGFDDVLIGAPGYPAGDPLLGSAEGGVFLFYGGVSGINATSATQAQWSVIGNITAENLGRAVAGAGDVSGDGIADVVISARTFAGAIADDAIYNGSPRLNGEGIVFVYNGSPTGLVDTAITVRSGQESGAAGYSVGGPADVNGDGLNDLIVGVPGYTNTQAREGAAFVHLSNGASPILPVANGAP